MIKRVEIELSALTRRGGRERRGRGRGCVNVVKQEKRMILIRNLRGGERMET